MIEEVTYEGKRAFHLIPTDRADTGDEHGLYSAEGGLICRFGGYDGRVTAGACEIDNIQFVRTLYETEKR